MMHHRGNEAKPAERKWRAFRERARETAFSPEQFGGPTRAHYDLDNDDPRSAGITGQDNPETYRGQNVGPGDAEGSGDTEHDAREMEWR